MRPSARDGLLRADEVNVIDVMANRFRTKRSPARVSSTSRRSAGAWPASTRRRSVWVMAYQRAVDDRDPPHRLADHGERAWPVQGRYPGQPFCGIPHRGDGPGSAVISVVGPLMFWRFHATRQRAEQNLACSRRGANGVPHWSQFRVSATESCYA